jgi:two-component system sensor kinase FixL
MPRTAPLNGAILETGVSLKVSVVPRELQIEREWSASERAERLASLLTLSYEPMLVWQLNGPIEFWNTGAERLYGFAPEEAIGHSSHALLQTKFPVEFDELITQLQNERYWSGELRHICKDGREVIVESRLQLLDDAKKLSCC